MLVEVLVYGKRTELRPSIELTQWQELYGLFRAQYREALWTASVRWNGFEESIS